VCDVPSSGTSPDATEATAFIRNDILSPCSVVLHVLGGCSKRLVMYYTPQVLFCQVQALSRAILFHGTRRYKDTLGGHGFRRYVNKTPETSPEDIISLESA